MKMPILSIYDTLIGFGTPFCEVNKEVAIRGFTNSIFNLLDGKFDTNNDPSDLSLVCIGEFDSKSGEIIPCNPVSLAIGASIVVSYNTGDYDKEVNND